MKNIKVAVWGFGSMGSGMVKLLMEKKGIEIVGVLDNSQDKVGKYLHEIFKMDKKSEIKITDKPQEIFCGDVDVVLHAANSFLVNVTSQLKFIMENKANVISIAEEMAYPIAQDKNLAQEIDKFAKNANVSIIGTGINPGFVLDSLILMLTGVCAEVDKIEAARINDLSPFGPTVMKTQGVGTSVEEFHKGLKEGTIVGHVGFRQSIEMIATGLNWELDEIVEMREPIVSTVYRETEHVKIESGMVAGCKHIAYGIKDGEKVISLKHPQQIQPESEGVETGDYIKIYGKPAINMEIKPEIPGGIGTIAVAVNLIPHIINARPGLLSMKDLPIPIALLGDVREMVSRNRI